MKYYKQYKIVRTFNPHIKAKHVLEFIKRLEADGNLDKAFGNK